MRYSKKYYFRLLTSIGILCVFVALFNGCEPLRKKFVRKKKSVKRQEFIPVLEPVDYAVKARSGKERYSHHFFLWKIWQKDLMLAMEEDKSDKRQKYLFGEVIGQLNEMRALIDGQKLAKFEVAIDDLRSVREKFDRPSSLRNMLLIKKALRLNGKKIRGEFNPLAVEDSIKDDTLH